uniref:Uncharacterized protein n=1 Tax=Anguilla anguilla TaxID=7936 RepID=A0A0E9XVG6_ANGAN
MVSLLYIKYPLVFTAAGNSMLFSSMPFSS